MNFFFFFSVKPAIFDLFLTATIVAYLAVVYFGVQVNLNSRSSFWYFLLILIIIFSLQTFHQLYAVLSVNRFSKSKSS